MISFIERMARAYEQAPEDQMPWFAMARDNFVRFLKLDITINEIESSEPYKNAEELRRDLRHNKISVWSGGNFSDNHPFLLTWPKGYGDYPGFEISRIVHDKFVHGYLGLSFDSMHELWGALRHHRLYSPGAQPAVFTDDVAIACYYMARGKFPEVQRPVVVKPDWDGLRTFLLKS